MANRFEYKNFDDKDNYIQQSGEVMAIRAFSGVPTACIRTYGCQQNVADSEKIKGMLSEMGFSFTENPEEADFILFNTCAVREHAEDRVFGNVGALKNIKRHRPSVIIGLCGCMMEQPHVTDRLYKSFPFVNLVFGTHSLQNFPKLFYNVITNGKRVYETGVDDKTVYEGIPTKRDGTFKGWLPIMYGCDNFCTYCIVPYTRGRERSRKFEDVVNEAREMIQSGYKEITLLGQNVNSYGKNLDEKVTFAQLLSAIDQIDGDYILRFMTSHPKDCSKELIDVIANSKHISTHLHLPFQSGNNRVLKAMNRHYTREKYLDIINYAKEKIPDVSLTSDIIVGFPGETYEEFLDTVSLIEEVEFTSLFTFIYSARPGTPAAEWDDPYTHEEKSKWFSELLAVQEEIAAKRCASMVGQKVKVLVEGKSDKDGVLTSRTSGNIIVDFEGDESLIGQFVYVEITQARNWILLGKLC